MSDVLDLMWGELQDELSKQKAEAEVALSRSERAETAGGILACTFAVLPYLADGASDGDLRFVTDACKAGELVGAGTGTPCYFDEGTNTWLRVEDDGAPLSAGGSGGAIPAPSGSVTTETSFGQASNAGAAATYSRGDHTHGTPANPVSFAVPGIALGSAAAGGAAGTVIRSDSTIVAFDATNPAASAPGDTVVVGVADYAARRDHRHAREAWGAAGDIGVETFGASAAAGAVGKVADAGHVHSLPTLGFVPGGRLTLTSGDPWETTAVTGATVLYYTPFYHDQIMLYTGAVWEIKTFAEISIAVPATTSTMYDVFIYDNAGTVTLELTAWTNDTTRATALTYQNGRLVKMGATTRLYLGSFRTTTVSGQTEDSTTKRYLWNYYNQIRKELTRTETTASWTYTSTVYRALNNSTANRIEIVTGISQFVSVQANGAGICATGPVNTAIGVGIDSTSVNSAQLSGGQAASSIVPFFGIWDGAHFGYHYYQAVEHNGDNGNTTTFYGSSAADNTKSGIHCVGGHLC